jgi:hypothetical protein
VPKCVPIYNKAAGVINARNLKMGNSKLDICIGTAPPLENMFLRTLKTLTRGGGASNFNPWQSLSSGKCVES